MTPYPGPRYIMQVLRYSALKAQRYINELC